jgi:hypothetical protein
LIIGVSSVAYDAEIEALDALRGMARRSIRG